MQDVAPSDPRKLIEAFAGLTVLIVGDAMLDCWLDGAIERVSREAPVPIVAVSERRDAPGGAGNAAVNVAALGARPVLVSVVGDDGEGTTLRNALAAAGVDTSAVIEEAGRRTPAKHRVVASGQMLVRFDQGGREPPAARTEERVAAALEAAWERADAVLVSDNAHGLLSPRLIAALESLQRRAPRLVVVDAKRLELYRELAPTAVKPNHAEAVALVGSPAAAGPKRVEAIASSAEEILARSGARIAAVTLDRDGALVFERGAAPVRTLARPASDDRAAGAGDSYAATLCLALAVGASTRAAAELAALAAALVVERAGTVAVGAGELRDVLSGEGKRLPGPAALAAHGARWRAEGRRIVFANGCFDIIHRGHITLLRGARALGDVLVVAVNSDDGVTRLKGPGRPINTLDDRLGVLAALDCVDHVVSFDEDRPIELIRALRPDVLVKGGDYTRESVPEAPLVEELGGAVHILPYLEQRSTAGIIARMRGG